MTTCGTGWVRPITVSATLASTAVGAKLAGCCVGEPGFALGSAVGLRDADTGAFDFLGVGMPVVFLAVGAVTGESVGSSVGSVVGAKNVG